MTQAPGVPKWGAGLGHTQRSPSVMRAQGVLSIEAGA